jgi:hypothetical protein
MTNSLSNQSAADRFSRRIAARLDAGNAELPHDIGERLRIARQQALSKRKLVAQLHAAPSVVSNAGGSAVLGGSWWTRIGAVVPLVALVAGLITISMVQDDNRATDLADVDSALLTGDLPPAAYTDPGFAQFLKVGSDAPSH